MLTKVIEQSKIDHFAKWMERADKIVIVAHVAPDGDAIGSSLGLWHFLNTQDKDVNVIVPNAFPDFLRWMPGSKDILLYDRYKEFADKLIHFPPRNIFYFGARIPADLPYGLFQRYYQGRGGVHLYRYDDRYGRLYVQLQ